MSPARSTIAAGLLALLLAGCDSPGTYVVLLDQEDGTRGTAITVRTAGGAQTIDQPGLASRFDAGANAPSEPFVPRAADIARDFTAVRAMQPPAPERFLLYFETGTADLTADSSALLPRVIAAVEGREAPDVSVIGHTDTTGTADLNARVSRSRAERIADVLIDRGLPATLVEVRAHGEADLLVPTPDDTDEPRNRRVEVIVR